MGIVRIPDNPYLCSEENAIVFVAQKLTNETNVSEYNKVFLPVLFISYMAGITLFTHSHVVNGVTIVHSHPFKKGT